VKKKKKKIEVESVRRLMSTLPSLNKKILRYLFEFINKVKENSSSNQMHEGNLAIVFGPNLLRARDSKADITDTPKILAAVQTMINYHSFLFADTNQPEVFQKEKEALQKQRYSWRPVKMEDGR